MVYLVIKNKKIIVIKKSKWYHKGLIKKGYYIFIFNNCIKEISVSSKTKISDLINFSSHENGNITIYKTC